VLGGRDQEVEFRELDVRVLLSTQDLSGYETVPLARIKRAGEAEARPQLDEEYIPPLLAIEAWPPLSLDIVRAIYDMIGEKIDILSQRVVDRGISLSSQEPGDLDDLFMLMLCNGAYGSLRCLAFASGVHPFTAYTELCRIVSQLSIFHETCRPPEIPLYDHDDLGRIFRWMKQQIQLLLHRGDRLSYEQRFFVGTERGMQVTIEPKWLHAGWSWFVGVNSDSLTDRECRDLLKPGKLDWKIGSSQQVDLIFKRGLPGVLLDELPEAPRALPARQGWIFYEVKRDKDNQAWKDVLATQTLAMRLTERLILNFQSLQGHRSLEVAADGKRTVLQFALFAVPSQTS
jgi:type VI secretion system protein ImpJ